MKTSRQIFRAGAAVLLSLGFGSNLWAEPGRVSTELNAAPPTEAVVFSFADKGGDDGWGWSGLEDEWRDVGMSFRSPTDSSMQKITLHLQKIPMPFLDAADFRLRVYETQAMGERPDSGKLVYEGLGEITLNPNDQDSYLTWILDQAVPLQSGAIYSFVLSWQDAAPYQLAIFHIQSQYLEGQMWYRQGRDGDLTNIGQTDRPGLIFYVQESLSQPTPKK